MTRSPTTTATSAPALVDAGVELARASGPDGVVLREVARRTGVSHNAAYRHFADRDELLAEVAALAAWPSSSRPCSERLDGGTRDRPGARARRAAARDRPGLRRLRAARAGPVRGRVLPRSRPDRPAAMPDAAAPTLLLGQVLDELVEAGAVSPAGREGADVACWAAVHGFACCCSTARCGGCLPPTARRCSRSCSSPSSRGSRGRWAEQDPGHLGLAGGTCVLQGGDSVAVGDRGVGARRRAGSARSAGTAPTRRRGSPPRAGPSSRGR